VPLQPYGAQLTSEAACAATIPAPGPRRVKRAQGVRDTEGGGGGEGEVEPGGGDGGSETGLRWVGGRDGGGDSGDDEVEVDLGSGGEALMTREDMHAKYVGVYREAGYRRREPDGGGIKNKLRHDAAVVGAARRKEKAMRQHRMLAVLRRLGPGRGGIGNKHPTDVILRRTKSPRLYEHSPSL